LEVAVVGRLVVGGWNFRDYLDIGLFFVKRLGEK
jgi:hypothetical protein